MNSQEKEVLQSLVKKNSKISKKLACLQPMTGFRILLKKLAAEGNRLLGDGRQQTSMML
jgi:hypothetical protein